MAKMAASDVLELLDLVEARGIAVWLNGGWGVDALIGHQTREHDDLDITISATDRQSYSDLMADLGFTTFRVDNDFNWVLVDDQERLVDVHLVDFSETRQSDQGATIYGPAGLPFEIGSLEGRGNIAGRKVNCETADFQVRGHTRYTPEQQDYLDVLALCQAFSIEVPQLFRSMGFARDSRPSRSTD
jgi:lincosamide nucleotidyltransferase A/C/D/E